MKNIVETTGSFQLLDPSTGFLVVSDRPSVPPEQTTFLATHASNGNLRILGSVNDEATDAEFVKTWEETKDDKALAVESFISQFPDPSKEPELDLKKEKGKK